MPTPGRARQNREWCEPCPRPCIHHHDPNIRVWAFRTKRTAELIFTAASRNALALALKRRRPDRDNTPDNLVFVSRYNKPWKSWSTGWQNACERAGLEAFRFHDLRHCFGSWLAMKGTALKSIMELMGHKTVSMTMRYSHLSVDSKRQAVPSCRSSESSIPSPQKSPKPEKAKVVRFRK
jgi:integrase